MAGTEIENEFRRGLPDDQKRELIVTAAKDVFAKKGYNNTSVEAILKKAGISRGTFYRYFKNKREVFDALVESLFDSILRMWSDTAAGETEPKAPGAVLKELESFIRGLYQRQVNDKELVTLVWKETQGIDEQMDIKVREFTKKLSRVCEAGIKNGMKHGLVRPMNPRVVAYSVIGMINELVKQGLEDDDLPPPEICIEEVLFFYLFGIASPELLPGGKK